MTYGHAWLVWRILALVLIAIYCIAGTIGVFAAFGSSRDTAPLGRVPARRRGVGRLRALGLSGVPVHLGRIDLDRSRAGGLPLFWTLFVPLAAAVLIALAFALARRPAAPA